MSTARHHAEWLSLVEVSGPFLSLPVLLQVFPNGLEAHEPEQMRLLRLAHEEWEDNQKSLQPETAIHRAWVEFVLQETLGLPGEVLLSGQAIPTGLQVTIAEHQETLRPDWVVVNPRDAAEAGKPRLLVQMVPAGQDLEKGLKGSRWAASPATRMMELLHACNVRLGLLTNGEHWMLVNAPKGETTGYISWYATLWQEEPITLRAFRSLLGVDRFFRVDEPQTLEVMLAQSINSQQEVTDQLGYQVRKAVDVLVQSIDRIDQDRNRSLLQGISETRLYEAALTVMMRLVFLFSAEERKLIPPHENELYNTHYAVSTLRSRLREQADQFGEEVLERRQDAWCRLLATFRAVYAGVDHDALFIPAYGGSLFDPDRFPFLEGRREGTDWKLQTADPIPVNNRTVLHLLEALQILQVKVPGGGGVEPRKLSFRALDIEQIGHVYEGLLDHTAVRAAEPILGLVGTKDKEPEISLAALEAQAAKGESALVAFLKEQTGKSLSALQKVVATQASQSSGTGETPQDHQARQRLLIACNNDRALLDRILPFAKLIRFDTLDYPVVIPAGSVYVTAGVDRRQSGTHYTPRNLTEEIVQYTLEPLVYEGVAEGKPRSEWRLRSPAELLQLKICDMAMGSGAFLVQTCRYLAEKLVEAWQRELENPPHPSPLPRGEGTGVDRLPSPSEQGVGGEGKIRILPDGSLSRAEVGEHILPTDPDERLTLARRIVADRCLYGVDKNPLAVEMAKLSLWLITLAKGRPFTFVDHALKWGDSLLGITRAEQIEYLHLNPDNEAVQYPIAAQIWQPILQDAIVKRRKLESFSVNGIEDLQEKERLFWEAEQSIDRLRFVGDFLVGRALADAEKTANLTTGDLIVVSQRIERELAGTATAEESREITALKTSAQRMLNLGNPANQTPRKPFHWLLEFPEVFLQEDTSKGFAAIVGNPPFMHGSWISSQFGETYATFIRCLTERVTGKVDYAIYFLRRTTALLNEQGTTGLILTDKAHEGSARKAGFEYLINTGSRIIRARKHLPWTGDASVLVCIVHISRFSWHRRCYNSSLDPDQELKRPKALAANEGTVYLGAKPDSLGFVLTPQEAKEVIHDPMNHPVVKPYFVGTDLNEMVYLSPKRFIIDFSEITLEDAEEEYPHLLKIVEEKVKPSRLQLNRKAYRERWWQFTEPQLTLFQKIRDKQRVIATSEVSKFFFFRLVPTNYVYSNKVVVFNRNSRQEIAILSSEIHRQWGVEFGGTHGSGSPEYKYYKPTECGRTFPFPCLSPELVGTLSVIGEQFVDFIEQLFIERNEGATSIYNHLHNPDETATDIQKLRKIHINMDQAVALAYGWQDLDLGHGFHQTKQGIRFTISETARREVLDRLLELNHQRYAEEVAQGLHDKKKSKGKGQKAKGKKLGATEPEIVQQGELF